MKQLNQIMFILTIQFNLLSPLWCADDHRGDKWIVITTINYPSPAVKKLATLKNWHLVVVGDRKTPKDWYLENCEFLSIDKQQALDYEIIKLLPENHYCRKNIGYLYAISSGAQVIYETDDDNELIDEIIPLSYDELVEVNVQNKNCVNIFSYFGQPTVWPRGFPLNHIVDSSGYQVKKIYGQRCGVIQGLINKDPDVDAIFRLTQHKDVYFDEKIPCVLPARGVFCPFNTQNTIFRYEAFWGLIIPSTVSFRVCDIWRAYIVQRLLGDLNLRVCFTSPTAIQERNPHNLLRDFCEEQDLYLKSGNLIQFLLNWKNESVNFPERIENLIKELVAAEYLKNEEIALFQAWIRDLTKLGYQFPHFTAIGDNNVLGDT